MNIRYNHQLKQHNTFGVNAECRYFIEYNNEEELCEAFKIINGNADRWLHIGGGSNLLFADERFEGCILHSGIKGITVVAEDENFVTLSVGAGEVWDDFVAWSIAHGYYGAENLSLIPGEVGAAAVQNIGAYGAEVEQLVEEVEAMMVSAEGLTKRIFTHKEMNYAYRSSILKKELRGQGVVTHVKLCLSKNFKPNLLYRGLQEELSARGIEMPTAGQLREIIIDVRRRKLPDTNVIGCAGSFYKNPVVEREKANRLLAQHLGMPHFEAGEGVKIPAGWLIEQCGWKGRRVGDCGVYDKQALVLVNYGGAQGCDIVALSDAICRDVNDKFGIALEKEVEIV